MTKKNLFIVGAVLGGLVICLTIWGFALGTLTADRRLLLHTLIPLGAGFAAGSFTGGLTVDSAKAWQAITVSATGGFGVWLVLFMFFPHAGNLTLVVQVHGPGGELDAVTSGHVSLQVGQDPRGDDLNAKGQVEFKNIPADFENQEVAVRVTSDAFVMVDPNMRVKLHADQAILVPMKPKPPSPPPPPPPCSAAPGLSGLELWDSAEKLLAPPCTPSEKAAAYKRACEAGSSKACDRWIERENPRGTPLVRARCIQCVGNEDWSCRSLSAPCSEQDVRSTCDLARNALKSHDWHPCTPLDDPPPPPPPPPLRVCDCASALPALRLAHKSGSYSCSCNSGSLACNGTGWNIGSTTTCNCETTCSATIP